MASVKTSLHDLAECPVCKTTDGEPKRLPCDHTCCLNCISSMLDSVRETAVKMGRIPSNEIACPLCRKPVYLLGARPDRLPTNLLAKQLQEMVKKVDEISEATACQVCKEEKRAADNFCKECKVYMCNNCAGKHKNREAFKEHSLVSKALVLCEKHDTQSHYLCTDCNTFLCLTCVNDGRCEGHQIKQLSESVQMKLEEIEALIAKVELNIECNCGGTGQGIMQILTNAQSKLSQAEEVKMAIRERSEKLQEGIKQEEQNHIDEVGKWEKIFIDVHENFSDHMNSLKELLIAATEAKTKGVQQMILAMPAIRSQMPKSPSLPSPETMNTEVKFIPAPTQKLGELQFSKSAAPSTPSLSQTWIKEGLLEGGRSVAFTSTGSIAVCDYSDKNVILYNSEGKEITSAKSNSLNFLDAPQGIIHHPFEPSIVVAEGTAGLLFLDDQDLNFKQRIKLEGELTTLCVAILSKGTLVVGTRNPPTIGLHDDEGKLVRRITTFGSSKVKVMDPYHINVTSNDHIIASMRSNNKVVCFSSKGETLKVVDVSRYGYPCGLTEDPWGDLLVACGIWLGTNHVVRCHGDTTSQIQSDITLQFTHKEVKDLGGVQSVAVKGFQLAVLFSRSLALYQWAST